MSETKPFFVFLLRIIEIILVLTVWGGVSREENKLQNLPVVQVAVLYVVYIVLCSAVERN